LNRCGAWGKCPLGDALAVNTQQPALLIKRSKSSVNALFAELGYFISPEPGQHMYEFMKAIKTD
jgi:hypothetical protein